MKNKIKFLLVFFAALSSLILSCGQSADKKADRETVISEISSLKEIRDKIDIKTKNSYDSIEYRLGKYTNLAVDYKDIIDMINERTDELINFIQGLKIEIVFAADGHESPAITGGLIDAGKITKLNKTKAPADILLGEKNDGKAIDLKAIIQEYKIYLIQVTENNSQIVKIIESELNTDDLKKSEPGKNIEEIVPWHQIIFLDQPVGSVLVILTRLQNNAKNAESEVLSFMLNKIDSQI